MSKRTTTTAPVAAPISPLAAAESALDNLIYNTYTELRLTERRRNDALENIQSNAAYLSRSFADIAERASEGASPSMFDNSLYSSTSQRLNDATIAYRAQTDLLDEQRRLLKRLLACTTEPKAAAIVDAANRGEN